MQLTYDVVGWLQLASWTLLGLAAANVWRTRRDEASRWLALTFVPLGIIVALGRFLPEENADDLPMLFVKVIVAALVFFPYFLHRFVFSFVEAARWERMLVQGLTGTVLVVTFVIPRFPRQDEPRPGWLIAYTTLFAAQWGFVLIRVAWRLWTARRGQPAIARRRLTTMGVGAAGFAVVLIFSVFSPSNGEPTVVAITSQIVSLCLGPFFLLGFAPPRTIRVLWRRQEEAAVRDMEIGLARSLERSDVAESFLPSIVALLGGRGAALLSAEGSTIGLHGMTLEEIHALTLALPTTTELYEPFGVGRAMALRMENAWLVVTVGPFTPFFGTDELQMLAASAVVADLALGRATLFELERQSREAMRDFVAIASHDLRTPVTVIRGFSELMSTSWDELEEDDRKEFAVAINRQVAHLDRLIGDLLTVSKLDVGEVGIFAERVELTEIVTEAVRAIAGDADVDVSFTDPTVVFADPEHIARMVQNYLTNALVHGSPPFAVEIHSDEAYATVRVRDGGSGVPDDFLPRLFEKFARVDKKKSKAGRGTGLGLSIVRGLARANGGDAWYEPNTPKGASFAMRLPLAAIRAGERVDA